MSAAKDNRSVILRAAKDLLSLVILRAAKDLLSLVILSAAKDPLSLVILSAAKDLLLRHAVGKSVNQEQILRCAQDDKWVYRPFNTRCVPTLATYPSPTAHDHLR